MCISAAAMAAASLIGSGVSAAAGYRQMRKADRLNANARAERIAAESKAAQDTAARTAMQRSALKANSLFAGGLGGAPMGGQGRSTLGV